MSFRSLALPILLLLCPAARPQGFEKAPVPDYGAAAERDRNFDLVHVKIDVRLDLEAKRIAGKVTHTLVSLRDRLTEVVFDSQGLNIDYVALAGRKIPYRTGDATLMVQLDRTYGHGDELEIEIGYDGSPSVGMYWVGPERGYPDKPYQCWTQGQAEDNHYWVPVYDRPNDRCTWETLLTVKEGLTAVSNGRLLGVRAADAGWRTYHHHMQQPNSTYLIALAVGPWERYADSWRNRQIEYFVSAGVGEDTARRSFGMTPDILEFFSEVTGVEYPWSKYAQVAVAQFVVGGMENVSCTLQTDRTLHDKTAAQERSSTSLVAHEAAHQWFGDLLTCRTWGDLWLNEGFATYYQKLYTEKTEGVDDFRVSVRSSQQSFMRADPEDKPRAMVTDFYSRPDGRKSSHVYSKGASVLHMLRFVLGDEAYHRSIQHYLEKHRLGLVETRDLQIAVAETTGRKLEWFFEQWVYLAGYPHFEVSFEYDPEVSQGNLKVAQVQKTGGLVPVFRTPVDVEFVVNGNSQIHRLFISEQEQVFSFSLPGRPSRVRFDKGGWITKKLTFERSAEEWMEIAERDDDIIGRLLAVEALKESKDHRATACLERIILSEDHHRVRGAAVDAIAAGKKDSTRSVLLKALADGEPRIRVAVCRALSGLEADEQTAAALREVLATDPAYGPRAAAVRALATMKAESAFDAAELALIIPSDKDEVARAALSAMVTADKVRAAPYVVTAATYGVSIDLRHEALRLVGRVADALEEKDRKQAIQVIQSGLSDQWSSTRRRAIGALSSLKAKESLDLLDALAENDSSRSVRSAAKRAAERIREGRDDESRGGGRRAR